MGEMDRQGRGIVKLDEVGFGVKGNGGIEWNIHHRPGAKNLHCWMGLFNLCSRRVCFLMVLVLVALEGA